jgi:hypothetical protein
MRQTKDLSSTAAAIVIIHVTAWIVTRSLRTIAMEMVLYLVSLTSALITKRDMTKVPFSFFAPTQAPLQPLQLSLSPPKPYLLCPSIFPLASGLILIPTLLLRPNIHKISSQQLSHLNPALRQPPTWIMNHRLIAPSTIRLSPKKSPRSLMRTPSLDLLSKLKS